ncbi:MAG: class I SAM-dependent methyltransferase [Gammaproteobacteria bacterium]
MKKTGDSCKICEHKLYEILNLGSMPSANNLVKKRQLKNVKSFPLKYYQCVNCGLMQLTKFTSSNVLFKNYLYMTSSNKALIEHFSDMTYDLSCVVKRHDLAYVVGSNDGSELALMKQKGFKRAIGIEPSNLADISNAKGLKAINAFFTYGLSKELVKRFGRADLVTANNVLAHIPDPLDMLLGMANLINDNGLISIEVHWLKSIIENLEIETLYAEHYFVWTIKAMNILAGKAGLVITDIVDMPNQHGGSLRFIMQKQGTPDLKLQAEEESAGIYNTKMLVRTLQKRADKRKTDFVSLIKNLKKNGKTIAIWSVPAKVPTLINFCGLNNKQITCAYEISTTKIGRYIPKANIQIKDEKYLLTDAPDYVIIGAWNYLSLAKDKLKPYLDNGGILINPLTSELIK